MKQLNKSISVKIWLSVSVLIIGYVVSMILVQTTGGKIKTRLNRVSDSLFPAAAISQNAVANFEKQTKLYQDAVMMGEAALVANATEESEKVKSYLNEIAALAGLTRERRNTVGE